MIFIIGNFNDLSGGYGLCVVLKKVGLYPTIDGGIMGISWLVGGFNHLETYERQWEGLFHILWKLKVMFQTTNQIIN